MRERLRRSLRRSGRQALRARPRRRSAPYRGGVIIPGDGNCLFRALAYPDGDHRAVRAHIGRHLEAHWHERYRHFVTETERPDYLRRAHAEGVWGDELSLAAFVALTGDSVDVWDPHGRLLQRYGTVRRSGGRNRHHALRYDARRAHYDVLPETFSPGTAGDPT